MKQRLIQLRCSKNIRHQVDKTRKKVDAMIFEENNSFPNAIRPQVLRSTFFSRQDELSLKVCYLPFL